MYNNNNNHNNNSRYHENGYRHSRQRTFREESQDLQSELTPEQKEEFADYQSQKLSPQGKENLKLLRRFYITLIVTGVVLGGFLTWGLVTLMNEWEMINPPAEQHLNN